MSQRGMVDKIERPRTPLVPPKGSVQIGFTHDNQHQLFRLSRRMNRPVPYIEAELSEACGVDERGEAKHTWKNDKVARPVCDVCGTMGKRLYTVHSQTGENIVARRKPHIESEDREFYLEDCGNCSVAIVDYVRPTDAELEREQRDKDLAAMGGGYLGEVFVDAGITKEEAPDIVRKLRELGQEPVAPTGTPTIDNTLSETSTVMDVPSTPTVPRVMETTGSFADQAGEFKTVHVPEPPKVYPIADDKGPWWTLSDGSRLRGADAAKEAEAVLVAQRNEAHKEAAEAAEGSY